MTLQESVAAIFSPLPPDQCCGGIPVRLEEGERARESTLHRAARWAPHSRPRRDVRGNAATVLSPPSSRRILRHSTLVGGEGKNPSKPIDYRETIGCWSVFNSRDLRKLLALARGACVTNEPILFLLGFPPFPKKSLYMGPLVCHSWRHSCAVFP